MADENIVTNEQTNTTDELEMITNLRNELDTLKQNTVSKEKYGKLLTAYANGQRLEGVEQPKTAAEEKQEIENLKRSIADRKIETDLDFTKAMLKIREYDMNNGSSDPFLPGDRKWTDEAYESAENCARFLQDAVDNSNDDPIAFRTYLQSHLIDDPLVGGNTIRR